MQEAYQIIEKSIIKTYRKEIWSKFIKAVKDYKLVEENDKIAVCISGGKDSSLLAKCLEELQKHGKIKFELKYIVMNPGYNEENIKKIKENLKTLNINAQIFETPIFEITKTAKMPCYLCAKMRRGYLYSYAQKLGCNKIALGHHYDDVLATILLNIVYAGSYGGMLPKLKSDNFENMELIRPLFYVREDDIKTWAKSNNLEFIGCACPVTKKNDGKRAQMKNLLNDLKKYNSDAEKSLFASLKNVNLNMVLSYTKNEKKHDFLDNYIDNFK